MEIINLDKKNKEAYQGLITIYEAKGQYDKITELASTVTDTDLLELFSGYIVAEPVFYPDEGTYDVYTEVTIFSIEECDIYYTLDESDPKKNGNFRIHIICSLIRKKTGSATIYPENSSINLYLSK